MSLFNFSFFLGLPSSLKENVIRKEICLSLSYMCKEPDSTNVDYENIESVDVPTDHTSQEPVNKSTDKFTSEKENVSSLQDAAQWRHNVDAVASLIENFSLGTLLHFLNIYMYNTISMINFY